MKVSTLLIGIGLLLSMKMSAQSTLLSGLVTDRANQRKLDNVIVTLKNPQGSIVLYTETNEEGEFCMEVASPKLQAYRLQFNLLGYRKQEVPLDGRTFRFIVSMEQASIRIKEVLVRAPRIGEQGDTLTYNVVSFANAQDRSIGDVLKRMPGIQVDKEGKIMYNGKNINKFYIEGKDLLEGRYGIATNGISHKDVARVEVMENHQPIKVLTRFTHSDRAAINLKLKDKAKAKWLGNIDAAGGYAEEEKEGLWKTDLFGMLIKNDLQNITMAKSNNTGENIARNIRSHYAGGFSENHPGQMEYVDIIPRNFSGLEEERTLFNRSHLFSTSQLWETKKKMQIKTQVDYLNNRLDDNGQLATAYYLPDGTEIIAENEQARTKQNSLKVQAALEINKENTYLKHLFGTTLQWEDIHLQTTGTYPNRQSAHKPVYQAGSHLTWMQRFGKQLVTFTSNNQVYLLPQHLEVRKDGGNLYQSTDTKTFYTDEKVSYSLALGKVVLSLEGGASGLVRSLETGMDGTALPEGRLRNDLKTNYLKLYTSPRLEYSTHSWNFTLGLPVSYYHYNLGETAHCQNQVLFAPSLGIRWKATPRLNLQVSGHWSPQSYDLENYYNGAILKDYRTVVKGYDTFHHATSKSVMGSLDYKYTLAEFFANINVLHAWNELPYQRQLNFADSYLMYSYKYAPVSSKSWLVLGNACKGLDFLKGFVALNANYSLSDMALITEGQAVDYRISAGNMALEVSGQPCNWMDWMYKVSYGFSRLESEISGNESLDNWLHTTDLNFWPVKNLFFTLSGEYYRNEITENNYKDTWMLDAKLTYGWKDFEIYVQTTNLLNKKEYGYNIHSELTSVQCMQRIRGREFLIGFCWKKGG